MALRDLAFDELVANLFVPDRLSVVFSDAAREFAPIVISEWVVDGRTATARIEWKATVATEITAAALYDADILIETFPFGGGDHARLLPGMTLHYELVVPLD